MCGISAYFSRESKPDIEVINNLLSYGKLRGTDGFGCCVLSRGVNNNYSFTDSFKTNDVDKIDTGVYNVFGDSIVGDIFLANHRAAPETEPQVDRFKIETSIQPIHDEESGITLIHNGSVSSFIYNELREIYKDYKISDIDSEAIIWAYLYKQRNMKRTMEYLSGGFAFIMFDSQKNKLYAVASHNPLYCGYVRGHGLFFSSMRDGIYSTISMLKGIPVYKQNMFVWEDYYCRSISGYSINEIDIDSGVINEYNYTPRYKTAKYDPINISKTQPRKKVLVSASGGLDSSTTLAVLKKSGHDVTAVHFKYGHRGEEAEEIAVKKVTEILDVPLEIFDLGDHISKLDVGGMLTDKKTAISTGTELQLKTTAAWTVNRNGFFMSYMGALAESLILSEKYEEVYLTGGMMQLTESGVYPDNSERFLDSFMGFLKYSSVVGTKIHPTYCCANLLKTEQYVLLNELNILKPISKFLVSCDRPVVINGKPHNCRKNGKPACGSGLLSYWACKMAGLKDYRNYYDVDDPTYVAFEPKNLEKKTFNIKDILSKIQIDSLNMKLLIKKIESEKKRFFFLRGF